MKMEIGLTDYGKQLQFKITLDYQMVIEGKVSKHTEKFQLEGDNAGAVAAVAIDRIAAPGLTNIVLRVCLDV